MEALVIHGDHNSLYLIFCLKCLIFDLSIVSVGIIEKTNTIGSVFILNSSYFQLSIEPFRRPASLGIINPKIKPITNTIAPLKNHSFLMLVS